MKKNAVVLLLLSAMLVLPAVAVDQNDKGFLSVSYSTEKEILPDVAEFSVAVRTSDKKSMQEASRKNKEISNDIYNYFKSNINAANGDYIKTSNYSATPVYTYNNSKRNFDRYEVVNNIVVHTKSLDKVSGLIDKSIELGATNVNSLNFTLSNKDAQCADLLGAAAKQVKSRANIIAGAVGSTVLGVKEIRTSCSANQRNIGYTNMRLMKAGGVATMDAVPEAASTKIESGNITMYANVDAYFYVK